MGLARIALVLLSNEKAPRYLESGVSSERYYIVV